MLLHRSSASMLAASATASRRLLVEKGRRRAAEVRIFPPFGIPSTPPTYPFLTHLISCTLQMCLARANLSKPAASLLSSHPFMMATLSRAFSVGFVGLQYDTLVEMQEK